MAYKFYRLGRAYGGPRAGSAAYTTFVPDGVVTTSTNVQGAMDQIISALTNSKVDSAISKIEIGTNPKTTKKALKVTYTQNNVTYTGYCDFTPST